MVLAFLEEKCRREAMKATANDGGAFLSLAPESSAAGAAHASVEDRVDA